MPVSLQTFLRNAPAHVMRAYDARKGLAHRRVVNIFNRLNGKEPVPGSNAGFKRRARYLRRAG